MQLSNRFLFLLGPFAVVLFQLFLAPAHPAFAQGNVNLEIVASGFKKPVSFAFLPGSSEQAVVAEQAGMAKLVNVKTGKVVRTLFDAAANELSEDAVKVFDVLPHPKVNDNLQYIASYRLNLESQCFFLVTRFLVPANPELEVGESEVLRLKQPCGKAPGGGMAFDNNGLLYVGVGVGLRKIGDGVAQSTGTLFGKVLRLDIDGDSPYAVPDSNPYAADGNANGEIWAIGFQSPNRIDVDRQTGTVYVSDQGSGFFDEINIVQPGGNYGWDVYEGRECQLMRFECLGKRFNSAALMYQYNPKRQVIGGVLYRGTAVPSLQGRYLYAESPSGPVYAVNFQKGKVAGKKLRWNTNLQVQKIGTDAAGNIYLLDGSKGQLRRMKVL